MKKQINRLIKNKTPFAFVIKMCILIGFGYLLIQLSNEAKNIEETQYISDMQNTLDYAEHYITWRYGGDWGKLGHRLNHDGLYSLNLETGIKRLKIVRGGQSEFLFYAWFNSTQEEIEMDIVFEAYMKRRRFVRWFSLRARNMSYMKLCIKMANAFPILKWNNGFLSLRMRLGRILNKYI